MVAYFPTPYPDELLYSICARYSDYFKFSNNRQICIDLFGSENITAIVDLPGNIQNLINSLPPNNYYTFEQIIENNTLFPFYETFLSADKVNSIKSRLRYCNANGVYVQIGKAASKVKSTEFLRYCPICTLEDIATFGETYWHRNHQIDGVIVCSNHLVYLEDTEVKIHTRSKQHCFFPASAIIPKSAEVRYLGSSQNEIHLQKISQLAEQIFKLKIPPHNKQKLRIKYLNLLIQNGFASFSLSLFATKLEEEFVKFYSPQFLSNINCDLKQIGNGSKGNWLLNLLRKFPSGTQHPLHHILLINFLGSNIEDFFSLPEEITFFGKPPWQCLNPAAYHYKQFVVKEFESGSRTRKGKPIGIFKCHCGFEFARSGPDCNPEDKLRIDKIIKFGETWENKLKELWNDSSYNLSDISRLLKVDPLTIKRYAQMLELSFDRVNKNYQVVSSRNQLKGVPNSSLKLNEYKTEWLSIIKNQSCNSLMELRKQNSRLYNWLFINDPEWLKKNLPFESKSIINNKNSVDWKERDKNLSKLVRAVAEKLLKTQIPPKRITKTAIGKEGNCLSLLLIKINKLPETAKVLEEVVESNEEFALRRIRWSATFLLDNQISLTYWNLVEKACVYKQRNFPNISEAIYREIQIDR